MTRARLPLAAAVVAAVLAAAAATTFLATAAPAGDGDFLLEASLEHAPVRLGEDAVILLTLTNRTASTARMPALRLARDSVSVRVRTSAGETTVTRLYGEFLEDETGALQFRPGATPMRDVEPGASIQGRVAVPAILGGELTLTPVLGDRGAARLEARPLTLEIAGRQRVAAQVETTKGSFRIDLDAAGAYASVANFWTLARDGYFDGLPFHRVLPGVLAQTGDPRGNGTGGPGWYVPAETPAPAAARGDVGFARGAHADSAGSQWFVVGEGRAQLAAGFVRLGTVTEGLDAVDALTAAPLDAKTARPKTPDRVVSVRTVIR